MRKFIIILGTIITLLLAGYTGYRSYLVWKQGHGIAMAKSCIARNDYREAFLFLQPVLKANPRNVDACRLMADIMEADNSPMSLTWRQRVLELDPGSVTDRLQLAEGAVLQRNFPLATNALGGVPEAQRKTVAYQDLLGTVALLSGQVDAAEAAFTEASRVEPNNMIPQVNLAVVQLHRTNALVQAEGRLALQKVVQNGTNSVLRGQARRELVLDAMRTKDHVAAVRIAHDLAADTNALVADKLLYLDILRETLSPAYQPTLTEYEREAQDSPAAISELVKWSMLNRGAEPTLEWLQQLPAVTRTNVSVEIMAAACQLQLGQWTALQKALDQQNWSDPAHPWNDMEFMRHAYRSRSLRGQKLDEAADAEWLVALKAASNQRYLAAQKLSMKALFQMAAGWNWNSQAEQILWTVVNQYPDEKWAFPVLRAALLNWHRTRSLVQLLTIMSNRDPENLSIKNDLAATAMLVGAMEIKPYELARSVYEKAPKNPFFAATYGYSLYLQGKPAEAVAIMRKLPENQLEFPTVAPYYGLFLKADGDPTHAKFYLERASAKELLPEEVAIFNKARAGL